MLILFRALVWLALLFYSDALVIDEYLDSVRSYEFVARFAFKMESLSNVQAMDQAVKGTTIDPTNVNEDPFRELRIQEGRVTYDIGYPVHTKLKMLIFQDFDDWTKIVDQPEMSCFDVVRDADKVISLSENFIWGKSGASYYSYGNRSSIEYQNVVDPRSQARTRGVIFFPAVTTLPARWGAIIMANCDATSACSTSSTCQGPVIADSKLHFINGDGSQSEFSYDDRSVQHLVLFFFILELSIWIIALHTRQLLKNIKKYHHTVKLLVYSVSLHLFSLLLQLIFWYHFASYGQPRYGLLSTGQYFTTMSNYLLIVMLILLGKGWTIVRASISPQGCIKLAVYATAYFLLIIFAQSYAFAYYDVTRSTIFFYASPPGVLLLLTRCVVGATWFFYAVHTTSKNFQIKKGFYIKFFWLAFIWMIAPAFFVLATLIMKQLDWTIFTTIWENLLLQLAHLTLCTMYDPAGYTINHSFPFHHTTSEQLSNTPWRIDIIDTSTVGIAAAKSMETGNKTGGANNQHAKEVNPNKFKGRLRDGGQVKHVFKGMSIESRMHTTINDVYSDIKTQASAIIYIVQTLSPKVELFSDLLEDWDVEDDNSDEDKVD